jgi:hypothetical protein
MFFRSNRCCGIAGSAGPVVLVGNEIGLGVIPLGRETRAFVDALGLPQPAGRRRLRARDPDGRRPAAHLESPSA